MRWRKPLNHLVSVEIQLYIICIAVIRDVLFRKMYKENKVGATTDPWGTPQVIVAEEAASNHN